MPDDFPSIIWPEDFLGMGDFLDNIDWAKVKLAAISGGASFALALFLTLVF